MVHTVVVYQQVKEDKNEGNKEEYDSARATYNTYYEGAKAYWAEKNKMDAVQFDRIAENSPETIADIIEEYIKTSGEAATNAATQYYDWLKGEA